jgi:hypothetical protein
MAAFLSFAPTHGVFAAGTLPRLNWTVEEALRSQAQAGSTLVIRRAHEGPRLVCRWQQNAVGRLTCHWDIEVPGAGIRPQ